MGVDCRHRGRHTSYGVNRPPLPEIFIPLAQSPGLGGRIIVRTNGDPVEFASTLRQAVHDVDPDMPVKNIVTLPDLREQALATPRLTAVLLLIFALIALTVTLAGVSGVIAISVTHRLKEFGIRMALGASRGQVLGVVVKEGLVLVAAGLVIWHLWFIRGDTLAVRLPVPDTQRRSDDAVAGVPDVADRGARVVRRAGAKSNGSRPGRVSARRVTTPTRLLSGPFCPGNCKNRDLFQ